MNFIDTHTHLFTTEFDTDRDQAIKAAQACGVSKFVLPNVDSTTIKPMIELSENYPNVCFPLIGLHPTSVNANFEHELEIMRTELNSRKYYGMGEIGIDLYWDKTFYELQVEAFKEQLRWAHEKELPVVIHSRNSMNEIFEVLENLNFSNYKGVFHCFSGNLIHAKRAVEMGFFLGIGGVITFKNGGLDSVITHIGLEHLVLETDSPWLAPVPHRGKRNESAYIPIIAQKLAEVKNKTISEIAEITTINAQKLFQI